MKTWAGEGAFLDHLKADIEVTGKLTDEQLEFNRAGKRFRMDAGQ